jgi:hypothetical protein
LRGELGEDARLWLGGEDWDTLGWAPDGGLVRGAYWVEVSANGLDYTVHGVCDVDGDGVVVEYTATLITPEDVY